MNDTQSTPAAGHNSGTLDLSLALDPDLLLRDMRDDSAGLIARGVELLAAFDRYAAGGNTIPDADTAARAGDFARQLAAHLATIDARRKAVKQPVLDAQRAIDGFYSSVLADPITAAKSAVTSAVDEYVRRRQREERERQAQEAARQRAEAQRLADAAEQQNNSALMDRAIAAEEAAAATAAAPIQPEMVRSDLGTTISTRKGPWQIRITDDAAVPRQYMTPNGPLLLALAKTLPAIERGEQPIPGVEYYRETKANIR